MGTIWEQIKYMNPLVLISISKKERGGTLDKTPNLKEPSHP
jgi:hypothetical protein